MHEKQADKLVSSRKRSRIKTVSRILKWLAIGIVAIVIMLISLSVFLSGMSISDPVVIGVITSSIVQLGIVAGPLYLISLILDGVDRHFSQVRQQNERIIELLEQRQPPHQKKTVAGQSNRTHPLLRNKQHHN